MLLPAAIALLCLAYVSPTHAIVCYGGGPEQNTVIATALNQPGTLCARYQFPCTKDDRACTAQDAGKLLWAYTSLEKATCDQLKAMPGTYKDLTCCSTNLCNAPDPKRDMSTKIYPGLIAPADGPQPAQNSSSATSQMTFTCYMKQPNAAPNTVQATSVVDNPGAQTMCLRYSYLCTPNDTE